MENLFRYTTSTVRSIAECYEEAYENGIEFKDRKGFTRFVEFNPFSVAEYLADFTRSRRIIKEHNLKNNFRMQRDILNGEIDWR